ncbi:MAG: sigma-70 family RNA polymerase sigma factor [bacterium]|nr:sigma-70 family RNA polymerase sigma factor [bacterium]
MEDFDRHISDRELLEDFVKRGHEDSFNVLVQDYKLRLFNVAFRVLHDRHAAEDAIQKVFLTLLEQKDQLADVESLQAWLYRTTLNVSLNIKKSRQRREEREKAGEASREGESPREAAAKAELREELDGALGKLKDSLRIPVVLRYLQGMSHAETGEILNLSPDAIRMRIVRALKKLRRLLGKRGLLVSTIAVEEGLRAVPAEAASASFLTSASLLIKAASTAGTVAKAVITTTSMVKGGLMMTAETKIAIGAIVAAIVAVVSFVCFRGDKEDTALRRPGAPKGLHRATPRVPKEAPDEGTAKKGGAEAPSAFGVLVWPDMPSLSASYSRSLVSWIKGWGYECSAVVLQQDRTNKETVAFIPPDLKAEALSASEAAAKLNTIVIADGDLPLTQVAGLMKYMRSGGWIIVPSPDSGKAPGEIEELLQLKPAGAASLVLSASIGGKTARALVSHPCLPGIESGQWVEWTGRPGKILHSRWDEALPLICFRYPQLPAVRLVAAGEGGVVHWNFPIAPGPLLGDLDLKTFLGETLVWLRGRADWAEPPEKEGKVLGVVSSAEGNEPIAGAKVVAQVYSESGKPVRRLETASSGQGTFSVPFLDRAIYWVKAEAEGYFQVESYLLRRTNGGEAPKIEVLMERQGAVFGHAYYGSGEAYPAGAVRVTLAPNCRLSPTWEKETVTDTEGYFSFDQLPAAQTFYLVAKSEAWMGLQEAPVPLGGGALEVDIHMSPLVAVEGVTENLATGEALPNVEVEVRPYVSDETRFLFADALTQTTTSGAAGEFIVSLVPGKWAFKGRKAGFCPVPGGEVMVPESGEPELIYAPGSKPIVRLCPEAILYGTVFQPSGLPAPGAMVTLDKTDVTCLADSEGRYATEPFSPPGLGREPKEVTLIVSAKRQEERAFSALHLKFVREGEPEPQGPLKSYTALLQGTCPVDLHLEAPKPEEPGHATLSGTVIGLDGQPLLSAKVELADPFNEPLLSTMSVGVLKGTVSDSLGKFSFSGVREGIWVVRATKKAADIEGRFSLFWGEEWRTVAEDVPVAPLEVRVGKAHIWGRVVRADGTPVRDRYVKFGVALHTGGQAGRELFLDEHGQFALFPQQNALLTRPPSPAAYKEWLRKKFGFMPERLLEDARFPWERGKLPPEGWVRLSARVSGVSEEIRDVRWGEESLVVALAPQGDVRGHVTDADTGRPIPHVIVLARQKGRDAGAAKADDDGAFRFAELPPGPCTLTSAESGMYWANNKEIEVVEGGEVNVEIQLWTHRIIRGRLLLKETGQPVVAKIHILDWPAECVSGRDGRFALSLFPQEGRFDTRYFLIVPLEGTGLKSLKKAVETVGGREIDVGDIYLERQEEGSEASGEK